MFRLIILLGLVASLGNAQMTKEISLVVNTAQVAFRVPTTYRSKTINADKDLLIDVVFSSGSARPKHALTLLGSPIELVTVDIKSTKADLADLGGAIPILTREYTEYFKGNLLNIGKTRAEIIADRTWIHLELEIKSGSDSVVPFVAFLTPLKGKLLEVRFISITEPLDALSAEVGRIMPSLKLTP